MALIAAWGERLCLTLDKFHLWLVGSMREHTLESSFSMGVGRLVSYGNQLSRLVSFGNQLSPHILTISPSPIIHCLLALRKS